MMKTTWDLWVVWMGCLWLLLAAVNAQAFYNPTTGRWLNRDPIEEPGHRQFVESADGVEMRLSLRDEKNVEAFANNDGINKIDPKGEAVWWDCVACAAALVGKFGGTFAGCAYGCSGSPSYPYGQCLSDCLASTMKPCELWKSFKGNPAEWVGAAACISCGVRAIKGPKPSACDDCNEKPKRCLPCIPPVGSVAYRVDMPPSPPHNGIPTPHSHMYQMHQSPPAAGCQCFWVKVGGNPLPGIYGPGITPAQGGGVTP